jgi:hypothetical protein
VVYRDSGGTLRRILIETMRVFAALIVVGLALVAGVITPSPSTADAGRIVPCADAIGATKFPYLGDSRPENRYRQVLGPLLMPHAGGGGNSAGGQVTMKPGYWLWPLPPSGRLRISCEWPLVDIALTTVEIDGTALVNSAEQARRLLS